MKRMSIKDVRRRRSPLGDDPKAREIVEGMSHLQEDIILNKDRASIFIGTNCDYIVRHRGIETLIFRGICTEWGVNPLPGRH